MIILVKCVTQCNIIIWHGKDGITAFTWTFESVITTLFYFWRHYIQHIKYRGGSTAPIAPFCANQTCCAKMAIRACDDKFNPVARTKHVGYTKNAAAIIFRVVWWRHISVHAWCSHHAWTQHHAWILHHVNEIREPCYGGVCVLTSLCECIF